jgi:hypothetical protein
VLREYDKEARGQGDKGTKIIGGCGRPDYAKYEIKYHIYLVRVLFYD